MLKRMNHEPPRVGNDSKMIKNFAVIVLVCWAVALMLCCEAVDARMFHAWQDRKR